jgi:hypothetical protein
MPEGEDSPLESASAVQLTRRYLEMCRQEYGGGDCLGLLEDGPTLTREDLRTLGLALSLRGVLKETGVALKGMVSPRALVAMVVWTCCFYLLLWMLPEPVSKGLAAGLTLALLAWLPVHTVWSLMDGWGRLVHEVDRATSHEQIEQASERFRRTMGENTARVVVMLVTAVVTGGASRFTAQLPKLPGFARAAVQAEAQGVRLTEAGEVEAVAATGEGTFTLMVRQPGSRAAAAAEEAAEGRTGITTIIRHEAGNRQVIFNGQRWNVPADKSVREIPQSDPLGDELQEAAQRAARDWGTDKWSPEEEDAISNARKEGKYWLARLLERQARGRYVHRIVEKQFPHLEWNRIGIDAIDPATGLRYELLAGTESNMAEHGRRLAAEFFRMIVF